MTHVTSPTNLELLLTRADTDEPALTPHLASDSAQGMDKPARVDDNRPQRDDGADPNALVHQGWGVVAPEGSAGDRWLAAIQPLLDLRETQQGAPIRIERVPRDMSRAVATWWKARTLTSGPPEDQPRYLLLLGDLDQISLELQQELATDAFVGRLAFSDEVGYAAYAAKVLRWEGTPPAAAAARALLFTARDGTQATEIGYGALMRPSLKLCRDLEAAGKFKAASIAEITEVSGDSTQLLEHATAPQPAVLFSMSHGLGPPSCEPWSAEQRRALQGALCLGKKHYLTAEHLAQGPFLPGGMWVLYACFGAATPRDSVYYPWLRSRVAGNLALSVLPPAGEPPFVAALPKAALANPDGPLAILGHADLAWTSSFLDPGPGGKTHPERFYAVMRALVGGHRAGIAHGEIARFLGDTSTELLRLYDDKQRAEAWHMVTGDPRKHEARHADLWMRHHDLAGFILLGDPAARLPLVRGKPDEPAPVPGPDRAEIEAMEKAVLETMVGGTTADEQVAPRELARWVMAYREAGRAALRRVRKSRDDR